MCCHWDYSKGENMPKGGAGVGAVTTRRPSTGSSTAQCRSHWSCGRQASVGLSRGRRRSHDHREAKHWVQHGAVPELLEPQYASEGHVQGQA